MDNKTLAEMGEEMTTKPTEAQIKEFWEWCGLHQDNKGVWIFPDGSSSIHIEGLKFYPYTPPIDLNNLFKYAIPKLVEKNTWDIRFYYTPHFPKIYYATIRDSLNGYPVYQAQDKDLALALFRAIYSVMGGNPH